VGMFDKGTTETKDVAPRNPKQTPKVGDQFGHVDMLLHNLRQKGLGNLEDEDAEFVQGFIEKRDAGNRRITAAQVTRLVGIGQRYGFDFRPESTVRQMKRGLPTIRA
jgi:hypothetical protein